MGFPVVDTLKNLMSGLGTSKDKTTENTFVPRYVSDAELNFMHRSDWLARKIVDIIPNDMTREWRNWQADDTQIEAIEEYEKRPAINVQMKVNLAMRKARLLGGSLLVLGMKDRAPGEELVIDRVKKDDLLYLHVMGRNEVTAGEIERDIQSINFGKPKFYTVNSQLGTQIRLHPSRVVRFVGADILDTITISDGLLGWGDSVLSIVYDAVMNVASVHQSVAALVPEAKTDVIYMPELSSWLKNKAQTDLLTSRFTYANSMKSLFNMLLLEGTGGDSTAKGERWEQKQINFSQLPELMRQYLVVAAAAADIPVVRLANQSPGGLSANSDGEIRGYYDNLGSRQKTELQPAINVVDEVVIRSALGARDASIYYTWAPLWSMTEKEKADIFKTKADAARSLAGSAAGELIPTLALSDALVNTFMEDGSLPGLEAAIEEYGNLADQEPTVEEQAAALALEQAKQAPPPAANPAAKPARAQDATPRTLYVRRDVKNAGAIERWAKAQGLSTVLTDLHVTIIYSKTPIDWMKVGEAWSSELKVAAGGPRLMEKFGEGAVVLLFKCSEIEWRHEAIRAAGASFNYAEYQPHITITYQPGDVDITKIEPYQGEIVLGPEMFEEIALDYRTKIEEK